MATNALAQVTIGGTLRIRRPTSYLEGDSMFARNDPPLGPTDPGADVRATDYFELTLGKHDGDQVTVNGYRGTWFGTGAIFVVSAS